MLRTLAVALGLTIVCLGAWVKHIDTPVWIVTNVQPTQHFISLKRIENDGVHVVGFEMTHGQEQLFATLWGKSPQDWIGQKYRGDVNRFR